MPLSKGWLRWKEKRKAYPPNWPAISREVIARAGKRCAHCDAAHRWFHPITGSVVFLQAAHLDHDVANCGWDNLAALCQRCHLIYDARLHTTRGYMTRRAGRAVEMFPELIT